MQAILVLLLAATPTISPSRTIDWGETTAFYVDVKNALNSYHEKTEGQERLISRNRNEFLNTWNAKTSISIACVIKDLTYQDETQGQLTLVITGKPQFYFKNTNPKTTGPTHIIANSIILNIPNPTYSLQQLNIVETRVVIFKEIREWTIRGTTVQAEFISQSGNTVKLRGGTQPKIKEFDITELSDTDRKWLKEKL